VLQDGNVCSHKKNEMKKLTKTCFAVVLCCSLTVATPLLAQNDPGTTGTSQVADRNNDDDTGKWGLAGLLGLLGLLGLRKRDDDVKTTRVTRNP
jgi:MYXO-CTERM domain-containing protein